MELFNNIIWWINIAVICLFGLCFIFQLIFMFLFFLKPRKYKKSNDKLRFTYVIRAHNEEDVIKDACESCMKTNYPKDKFKVIVFVHNCSDNTKKEAESVPGVKIVEIIDKIPSHANSGYCLKLGMEQLKKENYKTDYFCILDADCQVDKEYLNACNDAANAGVKIGRTFEGSRNFTHNLTSSVNGLWYLRDSRVACGVRSALHLGCVMNGPSCMIAYKYAINWDCVNNTDDIEFTLDRLINDNLKVEYIENAVMYTDMPITINDVMKRNSRMSGGLSRLFFAKGIKCLGLFFKRLFRRDIDFGTKVTFLDQYFNIAIVPWSLVACIWFPLYYIYAFLYTGLAGPMNIWGLGNFGIVWFAIFVAIVLGIILIIPFWFQPAVSYLTCKDKIVLTNKKTFILSIILCPAYMLIQAVGICKGMLKKTDWKKITRSATKIKQ